MDTYSKFLKYVLENGQYRDDRTGVGTYSIFGYQMRFNLAKGFPAVTTKKLYFKAVVIELLWFIKGQTDIDTLNQQGIHIWDAWADNSGNLGPIYGKQWRSWETKERQQIDQLSQIMDKIKHEPTSRRLLVTAWNVGEIDKMALPPCHVSFQFYVHQGKLSCMVFQRAGDAFIGVPFNIASYALLTHLVAKQCQLNVGELIWSGGDCHIYSNHIEQVKTQLKRTPFPLAKLVLKDGVKQLWDYRYEDIHLENYQYHPAIKAPVAV